MAETKSSPGSGSSPARAGVFGNKNREQGRRGTTVATSFSNNTTAQVVALADIFPDKLALGRDHFNQLNATLNRQPIDQKLLFHGPQAFEQLARRSNPTLVQQ